MSERPLHLQLPKSQVLLAIEVMGWAIDRQRKDAVAREGSEQISSAEAARLAEIEQVRKKLGGQVPGSGK